MEDACLLLLYDAEELTCEFCGLKWWEGCVGDNCSVCIHGSFIQNTHFKSACIEAYTPIRNAYLVIPGFRMRILAANYLIRIFDMRNT